VASRFVGRAGQLLTQLIEGIGLTRADVYHRETSSSAGLPAIVTRQPDEIEGVRRRGLDRPTGVDPAPGHRHARQTSPRSCCCRRRDGITKLRGTEFRVRAPARGHEAVLIPTLHPSAVLRSGGSRGWRSRRADFVHVKRALRRDA